MIDQLGPYRVHRKLADGGMGSVFLGTSPTGATVVLKVPHVVDGDAAVALADEARMGSRLRHPAIVQTLDFFEHQGKPVLVVDFIDGPSLFDLRRTCGPLPAAAVAEIGAQLASALEAIHGATAEDGRPLNMLHRDVSPANVLVDRNGQARLIDLGISRSDDRKQKATVIGMVKGTLRYLAPEILGGADHSASSDVWALGVTLWEAAVGRYSVPGDEIATLRAALDGSIMNLQPGEHVDPALLEVLAALVAPLDRRLRTSRAAAAVLGRLAKRLGGGRDFLAQHVGSLPTHGQPIDDVAPLHAGQALRNAAIASEVIVESTEVLPRDTLLDSVGAAGRGASSDARPPRPISFADGPVTPDPAPVRAAVGDGIDFSTRDADGFGLEATDEYRLPVTAVPSSEQQRAPAAVVADVGDQTDDEVAADVGDASLEIDISVFAVDTGSEPSSIFTNTVSREHLRKAGDSFANAATHVRERPVDDRPPSPPSLAAPPRAPRFAPASNEAAPTLQMASWTPADALPSTPSTSSTSSTPPVPPLPAPPPSGVLARTSPAGDDEGAATIQMPMWVDPKPR